LVLVALGIVIGGIVLLSRPEREPEYGGKKLSEWVRGWWEEPRQGDEAIRHAGTNALSYFIRWISYEPAPWKIRLYQRYPQMFEKLFGAWVRKFQLYVSAPQLMGRMGTNANAAIPELVRFLNDPTRKIRAGQAAIALGSLGDRSLPILLAALTNGPPEIRGAIVMGIGKMGTNGWPAAPALTNLINDPNPAVGQMAAMVLRSIDPSRMIVVKDGLFR